MDAARLGLYAALGVLNVGFVATWMSAWGLSWLVAFPVLLAVMPVVRRIVGLIVETRPG